MSQDGEPFLSFEDHGQKTFFLIVIQLSQLLRGQVVVLIVPDIQAGRLKIHEGGVFWRADRGPAPVEPAAVLAEGISIVGADREGAHGSVPEAGGGSTR